MSTTNKLIDKWCAKDINWRLIATYSSDWQARERPLKPDGWILERAYKDALGEDRWEIFSVYDDDSPLLHRIHCLATL